MGEICKFMTAALVRLLTSSIGMWGRRRAYWSIRLTLMSGKLSREWHCNDTIIYDMNDYGHMSSS